MRRTLMSKIYDPSPRSPWLLRYVSNACDEIGFWDMQCTFTTIAGRGFEIHCTLITTQKNRGKIGLWDICHMLTALWREHISKTRHATKLVLEICNARWWVKSTIRVREIHFFEIRANCMWQNWFLRYVSHVLDNGRTWFSDALPLEYNANKKAVLSQRCPRDAQSDNTHMVWS